MEEARETALHPLDLYFGHDEKYIWEEFADNLQQALNAQLPSNKNPYTWKRRRSNSKRKDFGYETHKIKIARDWDQLKFIGRFTEWLDENEDINNLTILYYSGYGVPNTDEKESEKSVWCAKQGTTPKIDFSIVQNLFELGRGDKLVILNIYSAGSAAVKARIEILAACGSVGKIPGHRTTSLTTRIIDAMDDFHGRPFNVAMLYGKMLSRKYRNKHDVQPIHVPIKDQLRQSLFLSKHIKKPSVVEYVPKPEDKRSQTEPSVITTLTIDAEALVPVMSEWVGSNLPSFIKKGEIKIEGVYRTESCIVKVMMPIAIWRCLKPDPALWYDCLV